MHGRSRWIKRLWLLHFRSVTWHCQPLILDMLRSVPHCANCIANLCIGISQLCMFCGQSNCAGSHWQCLTLSFASSDSAIEHVAMSHPGSALCIVRCWLVHSECSEAAKPTRVHSHHDVLLQGQHAHGTDEDLLLSFKSLRVSINRQADLPMMPRGLSQRIAPVIACIFAFIRAMSS